MSYVSIQRRRYNIMTHLQAPLFKGKSVLMMWVMRGVALHTRQGGMDCVEDLRGQCREGGWRKRVGEVEGMRRVREEQVYSYNILF